MISISLGVLGVVMVATFIGALEATVRKNKNHTIMNTHGAPSSPAPKPYE